MGHDKVADPHFVGIKRFPVEVFFIDQLDELIATREDKEQRAAMNQLQLLARRLENNAAQLLPYAPEVTRFTEEVCTNLIISQLSPGEAALIFLSGFGDINEFCNSLHRKLQKLRVHRRYRLFIFHSQVQSEDQNKAFQKPLKRTANIIVANRGSESSLTIPYLRLVINFGINKEMIYNSAKRISELSRQWCSRASCIQREGRVGRVCEGVAVHLFTKEFYETLPDFGPPEIIRVPLAKTFLRAKEIGPQLGIPLPSHLLSMVIEPPSFVQFSTALHDLAEYGAIAHSPQQKISEEANVTLLGKFSLSLPLDLNLCRLVLLGILFGCPLDGIVIAAATAMYQDVFSMPMKIIMNDLHRFCHSLNTSTFSRMKHDDGCYSNPIMVLNMFIDWLQYKSRYPDTSRRDLAFEFGSNNAVKPARLLHFEEFVGDIARCVASCIPQDTPLYSELQTLSSISTERKGLPVFSESVSFLYKASPSPSSRKQNRSKRFLHFCNSYIILKTLIAAAAPDEILCGERACESSHPSSRTFAQKCINVIEKECFSLSHTLCMDLSKLDEEEMQEIDEAAFEELFENFPGDFDLSVKTKVVRDVAVLHFRPDPSSTLTKTAKLFPPSKGRYSTTGISRIPPEVNFFWRFGEQNFLWEIDEVDALFPAPSHPCALMWYRFDESKSKVNTVKFNFRNPTGFICQYDKPSQPYFAVATGAFASSGGSIRAPRLTVLPNMPTSLMMVLAFQLSTSAIEFLINKKDKTIEAIKINLVKIPCTNIEKYVSSDEISAINQVRKALSNVMALPLNNGCLPLYNPEITRIPELLHDLLKSCKPSISKSTTSNLQTLSMDDRLQGLVWEMVTPGKSIEDCSTSYYGEFRCSLVGTKPYDVKEVSHDQEPPQSTFSIEYTQSVSAKLLAESKRAQMERALNDLAENSKWTSPVSGKMKLQKDRKAVLGKKKVDREMKSKRKESKRAGQKAAHLFCSHSSSLSSLLEASPEVMVQNMDKTYLREEGKIGKKKKEKRKAEKKALLIQKEKMKGIEDADLKIKGKKKTKKGKKRKQKQGEKLPRSFSPLFLCSPFSLSSSPPSSPLSPSPLSSFSPALSSSDSLCSSLPQSLSPFLPGIVLSEYSSELRQKQDLDAQVATTSKQKLPTQSDTARLENTKVQTKSVELSQKQDLDAQVATTSKQKLPTQSDTAILENTKVQTKSVELRQKQDLDAQVATTSKQKLPTQSGTAILENTKVQAKSVELRQKQDLDAQVASTTKKNLPTQSDTAGLENTKVQTKSVELRQKQDLDAQVATTSKQKLPTQSDTARLENTKVQAKSVELRQKRDLDAQVATTSKQKLPTQSDTARLENTKVQTKSVELRQKRDLDAQVATTSKQKLPTHSDTARLENTKVQTKSVELSQKQDLDAQVATTSKQKLPTHSDTARLENTKVQTKSVELRQKRDLDAQVATTSKQKLPTHSDTARLENTKVQTKSVELRQKQDLDAQVATTSKQKLPTQSDTAGLENTKVQAKSVELRQKQDLDAQVATTSKQKLPTQSDTARLENTKVQAKSVELRQKQDLDAQVATTSKQKLPTQSDTAGLENTKVQTQSVELRQKQDLDAQVATTSKQKLPTQSDTARLETTKVQTKSVEFRQKQDLDAQVATTSKQKLPTQSDTAGLENTKVQTKSVEFRQKQDLDAQVATTSKQKLPTQSDTARLENTKVQTKSVEFRQKQDLDAQVATTSKQKLPTQSDTARLENTKVQAKSVHLVSQTATTNGNGKQTVSKPPTTATLLEEKGKTCFTTVERNPSVCNEGGKISLAAPTKSEMSESSSTETNTETANRCQHEVEVCKVSHTKGPLEETADSCSSKQNVGGKVATKEVNDCHSTGEDMAQLLVGFNSECEGQSRLRKEAFLRETGKVQKASEAFFNEKRVEMEKIQKEREVVLGKENVEKEKEADLEERERREAAISEKRVKSKKEHALNVKEEESKAAMHEMERGERKKQQEKNEDQKERKVALCEKEKLEKEKQTTLRGNEKLSGEEETLKEENLTREKRKKRRRKRKKKIEVVLATSNSKPAKFGIAAPETCERRSVLSGPQSVPTNGQPQTATDSTKFLEDKGKGSFTATMSNPTVCEERNKTSPDTLTKTEMSENGSMESMTGMAPRCQTEIEVLKGTHTKKPLKETSVSDITPTEQKAAGKVVPSGTSSQYNVGEHMAQFSVGFINGCGGETRSATMKEEAPLRKKDIVQRERETTMTEAEKTFTLKEKEVIQADLSEKEKEKVIATKEREKERAALGDKERDKRKKGEESDAIQKEREVALCKKEREEREKHATLKKSKNVKKEKAEVKEEDEKREKKEAKRGKEKNERKRKEASLAATNSDRNPPAHSGIAEPKGRSVLSVSQTVPTTGNGKKTVCKSLTAPLGTDVCADEGKGSLTVPTGHHERKKTGPETMSENGSTKSTTRTCRSKIEPLKVISDITPTDQKAAGKVVPSGTSAQCNVGEYMAQFTFGFINECRGRPRSATPREEAPLRKKDIVHKERETTMTEERIEAEKRFTLKEKEVIQADLSEKEKKKVIATNEREKERAALSDKEREKRQKGEESDQTEKKREVALCKKEREEGEKHATLKESKTVKTEEAEVKEENEKREKREVKKRKEKNERKKEEASLAATNPNQNPPAHSGIAEPKERSVVSVSQTVPTTGNGKRTVSKSLNAPLGAIVCTDERKRSLTIPTGHHERNKTGHETMSENGSTKSTTRTSRSKIEPLKVISDITPTEQKAAGKVVPSGTSSQYNVGEHMAQFSVGFINGCGGETRSATLKEEALLRKKDIVQRERETTMTEAEKTFTLKEKEVIPADLSEKDREKVIATKEKQKERAALSDKKREKRQKGEESDQIQKKREVALCKKEREEREKHTNLKESKTVKTEEAEVKEGNEKREKKEAKKRKEKNERKKEEASLAATNSDQKPPAHSGIAEPKGRSVVSVSQTVPTTGNGKKTVSKSVNAPLGAIVCADERKWSLTVPTGHHERNKTGLETMSENGSTKSRTRTSRSKIDVMKVISDITPTKQKAAGKVVPSGTSAQYDVGEHMAQFSFGFINECGGETRLATLREEALLRKKDTVQRVRETAMTESEKTFTLKEEEVREADLSEKQKEKVIATKKKEERAALSDKEKAKGKKGEESDAIQKEREVALCKKEREEREKHVTLKKSKNVKTEEVEMKEEDEKKEKKEAKRGKERNARKKKEASLAATNSDQNPPAHSGIAEPKGRSVVSASQTVPTTWNGKKTVSKSLTAPLGANVCTDEKKRSRTPPTSHHERKKTGPETMSGNGSTKSTTRTSRSKIEAMKVTQTKKPAKETAVPDGSPIMQNAASRVASKRIPAQPGTGEHMAQFLVDFINECGGQTRLGALRRVALRQYQEKYDGQYTFLSKGFLRQYDCFEIFEDSSGVCHVRVVGAQRRSLASTEPEKMEYKTKKSLSCKSVCDIKMTHSSKDTQALEGNLHSVPGSPEHIVQYLYDYLSTHFFPYGCPVSSLDVLYQSEYKSKFNISQVEMINADFLKAFSNHFVLQDRHMFVKLKEGVDHSDTPQLKGCPYTPQHVNDYFRRYLAKEGVVCTQQLQVLFSECYMKEFKMPQKPIVQFIQDDFFKQSRHLFVTFLDIVVFRK